MKKTHALTAIAVMALASVASASFDLDIQITNLGGDQYQVDIYGELTDPSDGLALFGFDLTIDQDVDLSTILDLDAPAAMASFDRNDGLTNPPGPANSGFGGTPAGATLLQVGGGQNTIGNSAPPVYPTGSVVEGIAQGGMQLLATGTLDTSGMTLPFTLTADNVFALMLNPDQAGPTYTVSPVLECNGDVFGWEPYFPTVTKVESMADHGALGELGIQIWPVPLVFGQPNTTETRYGLTQNVLHIELNQEISDASGITVSATSSSMGTINASVALVPEGNKLIATFDSLLPSKKIYTVDVTGAITPFQCEYVVLMGNMVNVGSMNLVDSTDRVILNTKLGQQADVAGPAFDLFRIGASAGVVDTTDRVVLNTWLGCYAD